MISPIAIDHTCLQVRSLTSSVDYYQSIFGGTFTPRANDPLTVAVEIGNIHFFLTRHETDEEFCSRQHISFQVESLESVVEELKSRNIEFTRGTVSFFKTNNYHWCEWRDPDGIRVECVERIQEN